MDLKELKELKENYKKIKNALPWLDSCYYINEPSVFGSHSKKLETDYIKSGEASPSLKLNFNEPKIIRFNAEKHELNQLDCLLEELEKTNIPLSILHTQVAFDEIEKLAKKRPKLSLIIESGDRKLIYHIEKILSLLKKYPNIYLCSYNFCNWLGHEELIKHDLDKRLLYGSHMPLFSPDASMGPIIMGDFPWEIKCNFAGNNLRRLLGLPFVKTAEVELKKLKPFIIDAHAHNQQPGKAINGFPTPDMNFSETEWITFMDKYCCDRLLLIPSESLFFNKSAELLSAKLINSAPARFAYMELFNPQILNEEYLQNFRKSLMSPYCVGVKIHPSTHKTEGSDAKYEIVFRLAEKYKKTIMTHSWNISDYNPVQYMSHPDQFRQHLKKYHKAPFVLGHAGGRPGAFDSIVKLCKEFHNVYVDFAGDYYHNGVVEAFASAIGSDRILFASDVDWFDPRCNLGMFLGASLPDKDLLKTLKTNALKVYF